MEIAMQVGPTGLSLPPYSCNHMLHFSCNRLAVSSLVLERRGQRALGRVAEQVRRRPAASTGATSRGVCLPCSVAAIAERGRGDGSA